MSPSTTQQSYRPIDLAKRLNISKNTLLRRIAAGLLQAEHALNGNRPVYLVSDAAIAEMIRLLTERQRSHTKGGRPPRLPSPG